MAKLKYKDKDGFWQELQVGTNVVANPTLTGTEQELTSLQVGNAKYKSGGGGGSGGKLYMHITDTTNSAPYFRFITYSTKQTSYTTDEVIQMLTGKQFPCYYSNSNGTGMGYIQYFNGPGFILRCVLLKSTGDTVVLDEQMQTVTIIDDSIEV